MTEQEIKKQLIEDIDYKTGDKILIIRLRPTGKDNVSTLDRVNVNLNTMEALGLLHESIRTIQNSNDNLTCQVWAGEKADLKSDEPEDQQ